MAIKARSLSVMIGCFAIRFQGHPSGRQTAFGTKARRESDEACGHPGFRGADNKSADSRKTLTAIAVETLIPV